MEIKLCALGLLFVCFLGSTVASKNDKKNASKDITEMELKETFDQFIRTYNKVYADENEYQKRFEIFRRSLEEIKQLQEEERGTARYGISNFSDITEEELARFRGTYRQPETDPEKVIEVETPSEGLPDFWDWRFKGVVSPVGYEGVACHASWIFSAVDNIESHWAIKKGELLWLSHQQVLDCGSEVDGCIAGSVIGAYKDIKRMGGLEMAKVYPYHGEKHKCAFNKSEVKVTIKDYVSLPTNEDAIASWIYKNGPVSATLNSFWMLGYREGISHPSTRGCNHMKADQAVLIVGFGTVYTKEKEKIPYWIIKNSWTELWGARGYYYLYRGDGSCGINLHVTSVIV